MSNSSNNSNNSNNNNKSSDYDADDENLCTRKALQLSLSPPRCPPYGTAHRSLLVGGNNNNPSQIIADHHGHQHAHSDYDHHSSIKERLELLIYNAKNSINHPHLLSVGPVGPDKVTRLFGTILPLEWQNSCRDSGGFQSISDTIVKYSIPLGAITNPNAAISFLKLTQNCRTIKYGNDDESQFIDVFFPSPSSNTYNSSSSSNNNNNNDDDVNGMIFFIHGGAWGSGKPWFYRLCAIPFLTKLNCAVAIVGYRVYPKAANVSIQIQDLQLAYETLSKEYPNLVGPTRNNKSNNNNNNKIGLCIMGHSSGAHIGMLMIIEHIKQQLMKIQVVEKQQQSQSSSSSSSSKHNTGDNDDNIKRRTTTAAATNALVCDSFVGISGPYDISHHFDYEAARGVEEISPMKPANGYTREQFRFNSPHLRLKDFLAASSSSSSSSTNQHRRFHFDESSINQYFPPSLFCHGIEDDTVPFTATSETAYILRCCGITCIDEFYVPLTGHQDAVIHLMLGGRAERGIVDWLLSRRRKQKQMHTHSQNNVTKPSTMGLLHSRL